MGYTSAKTLSVNPAHISMGALYLRRAADAFGAMQPRLSTPALSESCSKSVFAVNWYLPTRHVSSGMSWLALGLRTLLSVSLVLVALLSPMWEVKILMALLAAGVFVGFGTRPVCITICGGAAAALFLFSFSTLAVVLSAATMIFSLLLAIFGPGRFSYDSLWRLRLVHNLRRARYGVLACVNHSA